MIQYEEELTTNVIGRPLLATPALTLDAPKKVKKPKMKNAVKRRVNLIKRVTSQPVVTASRSEPVVEDREKDYEASEANNGLLPNHVQVQTEHKETSNASAISSSKKYGLRKRLPNIIFNYKQ